MPPPVNAAAPKNAHSNIYSIKIILKIHTLYTCLFSLILHTLYCNLFVYQQFTVSLVFLFVRISVTFFSLSIKFLNEKNLFFRWNIRSCQ
jgi:hypothetical protein